jgi:hypothetical protein
VFGGARFPAPEPRLLNGTFGILTKYFARFQGVPEKVALLAEVYRQHEINCDESTAVVIYYFMELIRIFKDVEPSVWETLKISPQEILETDLQTFGGTLFVNVDLVLVNMGKMIKRIQMVELTDMDSIESTGDFMFQIQIGPEIVISTGMMYLHVVKEQ